MTRTQPPTDPIRESAPRPSPAASSPLPGRKAPLDVEGVFTQPYDPLLEKLLRDAFEVDGRCEVEGGSWVRGEQNRDRAAALLDRHSLIHCIRVDDRTWFWFWSSEQGAHDRADKARLLCDVEAL